MVQAKLCGEDLIFVMKVIVTAIVSQRDQQIHQIAALGILVFDVFRISPANDWETNRFGQRFKILAVGFDYLYMSFSRKFSL